MIGKKIFILTAAQNPDKKKWKKTYLNANHLMTREFAQKKKKKLIK